MKIFTKSTLSIVASTMIVSGLIYAISYPSAPPAGETTGGKFRTELDTLNKIWSAVSIDSGYMSTKTPTLSGNIATKGYVDAQVVSAGGGGLKVYKSDGVTLLGNFLARYSYPDGNGGATMSTEYVDSSGNIVLLNARDMEDMTNHIKVKLYFQSNDCTGPGQLLSYFNGWSMWWPDSGNGKYQSAGSTAPENDYLTAYSLPNGDFAYATSINGNGTTSHTSYNSYWLGTSCISGAGTITGVHGYPSGAHDQLMDPLGANPVQIIKKCGIGPCKFK